MFLNTLATKTHYADVIGALIPKFSKNNLPASGDTISVGLENWRAQLHYKYEELKGRHFVLNLSKVDNPNQKTAWDIAARRK